MKYGCRVAAPLKLNWSGFGGTGLVNELNVGEFGIKGVKDLKDNSTESINNCI